MGGSTGHGLSGANGERENSRLYWNNLMRIWIIVWRVQLTFWEFRFGNWLPNILIILLWGCRGRIMLLVCHPLSPCHVHWRYSCACLVRWQWGKWGRGAVGWIDIQFCKEPCLYSSWHLKKGLSHRAGNLFMMEYHSDPWKEIWTNE